MSRPNKDLKTKVLRVLRDFPKSRDNDVYLTLKLWIVYYPQRLDMTDPLNPTVTFKNIMDLPREEHIRRHRAIIQNEEKKFLPTSWKVAKQRKILEQDWKNYCVENKIVDNYNPIKHKII